MKKIKYNRNFEMFLILGDEKSAGVGMQTSVTYEMLCLKGLLKVYLWDELEKVMPNIQLEIVCSSLLE